MGLSHSQLSLTFSGARRLKIQEAALLSQIFSEPLANIVEAAGVSMEMAGEVRVSVAGSVRGDGSVEMHSDAVERVSAPSDMPDDAKALQFRSGGSPLDWLDGALAFYRPLSNEVMMSIGRLAVAKLAGGPVVIGALRRGYRAGTFNISGTYSAESVAVEQASPVLLIRP